MATLIRLVGDFDVAEEAAQDACTAAVAPWPASGVPGSPRAWIIQTARHKAIDRIRGRPLEGTLDEYTAAGPGPTVVEPDDGPGAIPDDRLRLIFTCCHPALALEARHAADAGRPGADEIARACLVLAATMAQRRFLERRLREVAPPG